MEDVRRKICFNLTLFASTGLLWNLSFTDVVLWDLNEKLWNLEEDWREALCLPSPGWLRQPLHLDQDCTLILGQDWFDRWGMGLVGVFTFVDPVRRLHYSRRFSSSQIVKFRPWDRSERSVVKQCLYSFYHPPIRFNLVCLRIKLKGIQSNMAVVTT